MLYFLQVKHQCSYTAFENKYIKRINEGECGMSKIVFSAQNLSKQYRGQRALDSVNMEIRQGDIYGFVGENGAGKTTLIRVLTGLIAPTEGGISLFGESGSDQLTRQRRRVGGVTETPALYLNMNAVDNLEICRLQRGISNKSSVHDALRLVSLTDTGSKKAKNFSLGMKQRLGLAMALIGNPEFLVLDEPVNGLDPVAIVEFRELLKRLCKERGITVLISSHILPELHQLATCYGFIHHGKLLEQLSVDELNEKCKKHINIKVDDTAKATDILKTELNTNNFEVLNNGTIRLYESFRSGDVSNALFGNGIAVEEISTSGGDLEEYYMNLIGGRAS